MKIAVASQNKTSITEHAGHCQRFWIYDIKDNEMIAKTLLELPPEQSFHNSKPNDSHPLDEVQVVISGGMGKNLVRRLEQKGIEPVVTKETDLDKAVNGYLNGSLVREDSECHDHEHQHQHRHQHRHGRETGSET